MLREHDIWALKAPRKRLQRKPMKRAVSKPKAHVKEKRAKKRKAWKFVKTELAECDSAFSKEIIARDKKCLYPNCQNTEKLTCSHYEGRSNWNTRFDPENCIALCLRHHFMDRDVGFEFQKARKPKHEWDGQYTIFMRQFLGEYRFNALLERAKGDKSRKDSITETQKKYHLRQPVENLETVNDPC